MKFDITPLKQEMDRRIAEINAVITTDPAKAKAIVAGMEQFMSGYMSSLQRRVNETASAIETYRKSL